MMQPTAWSSLLGGLAGVGLNADGDDGFGYVGGGSEGVTSDLVDPLSPDTEQGFAAKGKDEEEELGDSITTAPTTSEPEETGSVVSTDDDPFAPSTAASSWLLGGLGSDLTSLAASLKKTAGGVVGFVQQSAQLMAAEIRELEHDYNDQQHRHRSSEDNDDDADADDNSGDAPPRALRLPWEVPSETGEDEHYREDLELQSKIFQLSATESTFFAPYGAESQRATVAGGARPFVLDDPRIQLIQRLLQVDQGLAAMQARLSGRNQVPEDLFWQNYFFHCEQTRLQHERQRHEQPEQHDEEQLPRQHPMRSDDGAPPFSLPPSSPLVRSRTKSDDDLSSYVCVNSQIVSPPSSLNFYHSEGDLVILDVDAAEGTATDDDNRDPQGAH